MAPFTNRQIGYIRAVSGKSRHKSFIVSNRDVKLSGFGTQTGAWPPSDCVDLTNKKVTSMCYTLNTTPSGIDARNANHAVDPTGLVPVLTTRGFGHRYELKCLQCQVDTEAGGQNTSLAGYDHQHFDHSVTATTHRLSNDAFLESTHLQFRFTMPDFVPHTDETANISASMHTPHYEWRFIIFRNKRPTYKTSVNNVTGDEDGARMNLNELMDGVSLLNPGYDLFMGQAGRPRGPLGWRLNHKFDEIENVDVENKVDNELIPNNYGYAGKYWNGSAYTDGLVPETAPPGEQAMTADDLMTMRLNRNDYVIHTDERFFLGQQFGKSHYEKTVRFDWKDFIDTPHADLTESPTLDGKNYEWYFLLMGTSNGTDTPELNVCIRSTTSLSSGT